MYHSEGILSAMIQQCRTFTDEPSTRPKYNDAQVLEFISTALDGVMTELISMAPNPIYSRYTFTTVADQADYMLPGNVAELHRVAEMDGPSGMVRWEWYSAGPRGSGAHGIQMNGTTSIRIVPIPQSAVEMEVLYVPGGKVALHQNITPIWTGTGDTGTQLANNTSIRLNHRSANPWFLGKYDRRPNGYCGQIIRLLGTPNGAIPEFTDSADNVPWMPVLERIISAYDIYGGPTATFNVPLDSEIDLSTLVDPVTYIGETPEVTHMVYEIVPDVDPIVMWLAMMSASATILGIEQKRSKQVTVLGMYNAVLRSAQIRWANSNLITGQGFDRNTFMAGYLERH